MSTVTVTTGLANISPSNYDYLMIPRQIKSKYGCILLHAAGATSTDMYTGMINFPHTVILAHKLAAKGIPCIAGAMGGDTYANDTVMPYVETARTFLNTKIAALQPPGYASFLGSKAHLLGVSMGGGIATRWASLNPAKAASVQGLIPMASIIDIYTKNPLGTFGPLISSAWGLTYTTIANLGTTNGSSNITGTFSAGQENYYLIAPTGVPSAIGGFPAGSKLHFLTSTTAQVRDQSNNPVNATATVSSASVALGQPLPSGADLATLAAALNTNHVPTRYFYDNSGTDPYVTPSTVTALATAAGGSAIQVNGLGHVDGTIGLVNAYNGGIDGDDVLNFILASDL